MWKFFTPSGAEKKATRNILHSCRAKNLVGQAFGDGVLSLIPTFEAEDWDTDGIHSTSVNPTRFTIPANLGGIWEFELHAQFPNPGAANMGNVLLRKNGSIFVGGVGGSGHYAPSNQMLIGGIISDLAVPGDYYEFILAQQSGGSRTTISMTATATLKSPSVAPQALPLLPATRVMTGKVNANGSIAGGTGFTVNWNGTSTYTITFVVPFAVPPVVLWQATAGSTQFALTNITANGFTAVTQGGAPSDLNFIAAGVI